MHQAQGLGKYKHLTENTEQNQAGAKFKQENNLTHHENDEE